MRTSKIESILNMLVILAVILIIVGGTYASWQYKRWINWKFGYAAKVDARIEKLEQRVTDMEQYILKENENAGKNNEAAYHKEGK